jgi:hypothetical protein
MSDIKNSSGASQPEESKWIPDVYYFPTQVQAELTDIQNNLLGKILTLMETLSLSEKQEKATKDLIRTAIKEQMIKTRRMLDERLSVVLKLGMEPIDMESTHHEALFTKSYRVQPIYDSEESLEGDGGGDLKI